MTCNDQHTCTAGEVEFEYENAFYDEHQHVIPGTCRVCGENVEFVYSESGIRNRDTREYIRVY
jgi:transcription initiation factor IIE alpha subunit